MRKPNLSHLPIDMQRTPLAYVSKKERRTRILAIVTLIASAVFLSAWALACLMALGGAQ